MNLMQILNLPSPVWAPQDDAAAAPVDPPAGDAQADAGAGDPPPDAQETDSYGFLPEEFRKDGENNTEGFRARFDELVSESAQREEALADVPEDGSGYEFGLPDDLDFGDLELPEDFAVELKLDDPAYEGVKKEFGDLLHQHGIPKAAANSFLGVMAKYQAADFSKFYAEESAAIKEMGTKYESRKANVMRALEAKLPGDAAAALKPFAASAKGIRALEPLLYPRGMGTGQTVPAKERTVDDDLHDYYNTPSSKGA